MEKRTAIIYVPAIKVCPHINYAMFRIVEQSPVTGFASDDEKADYMRSKVWELTIKHGKTVYGFEDMYGLNFAVVVNPVVFIIRNLVSELRLYYHLKFRATRGDPNPVCMPSWITSLRNFLGARHPDPEYSGSGSPPLKILTFEPPNSTVNLKIFNHG